MNKNTARPDFRLHRPTAVSFACLAAFCACPPDSACADEVSDPTGFSLGVAVGDVTDSAAIFWTRADAPGQIELELSLDESFGNSVTRRSASADPERDLTVKIELTALSADTVYFYRFVRRDNANTVSRTGRFRTAADPGKPAPLRIVFSGDSNFLVAPFTMMSRAAQENADLFIWFGDTIYSDEPSGGLGVAKTLDDYRAKYRQVRSDASTRELLSRTAVIAAWDDHEVFNDYAGLDPSLPLAQRDAGYQAFFEYMPIRDQAIPADPVRTYRSFHFGSSVDLFMLDERQYREESARAACNSNLDPDGFALGRITQNTHDQKVLSSPREMLGPEQFEWLTQGLLASTAAVKLVGNNVPLSYIGVYPYDRWDGYDAQRRALMEFIDQNRITGVVFLTTDIHANGYNPDLSSFFRGTRRHYNLPNFVQMPELIAGPIGNETARQTVFGVVGEITESAPGRSTSAVQALLAQAEVGFEDRLKAVNGLEFINTNRVSYVLIDVSAAGNVSFAYRGLPPETVHDPDAENETFFESTIVPPVSLNQCGCGAPVLAIAVPILLVASRRRMRR